jgi:uncharacterized protein
VLTYSTPPLTAPLQVAGTPSLTLYLAADAPSVDISAVLSEVYPDGRVFNLTQGYGRFDLSGCPGGLGDSAPQTVSLPLQPTHFTLPQGHALRLSLATAAFPAYPVNSGTRIDHG